MRTVIGILTTFVDVLAVVSGASGQAIQDPNHKVEVTYEVYPYANGESFGAAGPYERLVGTLAVEIDPSHPRNREIVDIDRAPLNALGRVEYQAQFVVLRPVDPSKANGTLFSWVPNRGRLGARALAPGLLRRGFIVSHIAWQGDILPGGNRLLMKVPVATNDGQPITGRVRMNYILDQPSMFTVPLGHGPHLGLNPTSPIESYSAHDGYEVVSTDNIGAVLTVRERYWDERIPISNSDWMFAYCPLGVRWGSSKAVVVPSPMHLCVPAGFRTGWIYELIYEAQNPKVMGLGLASTRDALSFFRFYEFDSNGTPNPLFVDGKPTIERVLIGGASQTGRYVRQLLYMGFHVDVNGRSLVDGLWAHVAAGRNPLNMRFAAPGRGYIMHYEEDFPSYDFPIAYNVMKDPFSDRVDGVLARCEQMSNCPKIIHTVSSHEYWNGRASLVTTDPFGATDLTLPDNVRHYTFAGTQHGGSPYATMGLGHGLAPLHKELTNPAPLDDITRALLAALDEWVRYGTEPPPSMYPRIDDGTLVTPDQEATGFPRISGVTYMPRMNELPLFDYGPRFLTEGVITNHPPRIVPGKAWRPLVPKVDVDGNDVAGVKSVTLMVPLGTYTAWNLRSEHAGAENESYILRGSFIPFARTKAERVESGDPRLSLAERYGNHEGYVTQVHAATAELVAKRLLLQEDADSIIDGAMKSDILLETQARSQR